MFLEKFGNYKLVYKFASVTNIITMRAKGKSRKKYDAKSAMIIKELAVKYEVSEPFVRMSISGDRSSETAEAIKKDYNRLYKAVQTALKK